MRLLKYVLNREQFFFFILHFSNYDPDYSTSGLATVYCTAIKLQFFDDGRDAWRWKFRTAPPVFGRAGSSALLRHNGRL
jgi:hypothetical protein